MFRIIYIKENDPLELPYHTFSESRGHCVYTVKNGHQVKYGIVVDTKTHELLYDSHHNILPLEPDANKLYQDYLEQYNGGA